MPTFMKDAIKKTFIELLNEMPLSKITVKMIVEKCGINRNSFYYYYQDIPALIEELVKDEADALISKYDTIDSVETALRATVSFGEQQRSAILHIYNSVSRDVFEQYLWKVCDYVISTYAKTLFHDVKIAPADEDIIRRFYRCECFGLLIDWLNRRMEPDVEEHITRFCQLYKGMAEDMIRRAVEG
ncbi:MAG: TetR/AcrR family transcriptional regulator C-terminal domain-containing protein [Clostridiales bacterium]|nr:TetR/AcrR family transcriptional regulator C-terminal domain-containing protein [Clostridiales bacterium]